MPETTNYYLFKIWRHKKRLTQEEVADHLGLTQSAYSKLESGKNRIDIDAAFRICDLYQKDIGKIFKSLSLAENKHLQKQQKEFNVMINAMVHSSECRMLRKSNLQLQEILNKTNVMIQLVMNHLKNKKP